MTESSDQLQRALARYASDQRRTIAYYGNMRPSPGSEGVPRRLISDFGFPVESSFTYIIPAANLVDRSHENRTPISQIVIRPYGMREDRNRLVSQRATDRRRATRWTEEEPGVRTVESLPNVILPAYLNNYTANSAKTARLVQKMVNARQGPAYHFVVTRSGSVIVVASIDDEVFASGTESDYTIDIAIEGAAGMLSADWEARRYENTVFELPYTALQLYSLRVLLAKLVTAVPEITNTIRPLSARTPGLNGIFFDYDTTQGSTVIVRYNFTMNASEGFPISYAASDVPAFQEALVATPSFDVTTEVFRPHTPTPPIATREEVRDAVTRVATLGELSPALASYATYAGAERSADMASASRSRFFVARINVAHRDADDAGGHASAVGAGANHGAPIPATNFEPHTFDFDTGFWGDGKTY